MPATDSYAAVDEIRPYVWQYDDKDLALFDKLGKRASRLFEIMCYVPVGYFHPGTGEPEARVFYGTGSVYLFLPPHYGTLTLSMPTAYTAPEWVDVEGALRTKSSDGVIFEPLASNRTFWPSGVAVTVTAKWGFEAIPEDVKEAVIELAVAMFRSKDQAFMKAVDLQNNVLITKVVPERTKLVADFYHSRKAIPAFV